MNTADLLPSELAEEDPLLDSAADLETLARTLDLEDWIIQRLQHPEREISVHLPLVRDAGASSLWAAYRVQHTRAPAGAIGPVLLAPDVHAGQLRPLALHMTLQCALLHLPLGGSAGAIVCDPAHLSERELRRLLAAYVSAIGAADDILVPTRFAAAWTTAKRQTIVGKPAVLGGIPDQPAAIAAGWHALIREALATTHQSLATVALQGYGAAAATLAKSLQQSGARIIALADKSGGLFSAHGLDLAAVAAHVAENGMLFGFAGAEPVANSDVLESDCDLLITAAAERQMNARNAPHIRARMLLEAVPNAVTPAAERALAAREITVMPGLLAAAPATLGYHLEWQHAAQFTLPRQSHVESAICEAVTAAYHRVQQAAHEHHVSLTAAARYLALEQFASVLRLTT